MVMRSFRNALAAAPQLGFCSMYPAPGIIERIGPDWDWCWIDAQHGEWGLDDAVQAVRACECARTFSLVRVPGQEPGTIGRMLDTGCHAVMVPMIESVEEARHVVQSARFAPQGRRSYGARRVIDLYGRAYAHADHPQPLVVCQIESPQAVEQVDAIAAVEGIDALFFGPDDMALARGLPMDQTPPEGCFDSEMKAIAEAASRHGKFAGGVFRSGNAFKQAMAFDYRLIVCSGDVPLLAGGSGSEAVAFRDALAKRLDAPANEDAGSTY